MDVSLLNISSESLVFALKRGTGRGNPEELQGQYEVSRVFKGLPSHQFRASRFFILGDPQDVPWMMQAYSMFVDTSVNYDTLKDLGSKLTLPAGWKYRVKVLDKDLTICTPQNYNWITQDNLQNTYDGRKEGACNFQP